MVSFRGVIYITLRTISIAAATNIEQFNSGVKWNEKDENSGILLPFARLRPSMRQDGSNPPTQTVS